MSLTTGRGPLSGRPAGRFSAPIPEGVVYVEPWRRRVRGVRDGVAVVDSERVLLVHRPGSPPSYAFPPADVTGVASSPVVEAGDYVAVAWDAVDAWYEEEAQVIGHPRNPYHRIDCVPSSRLLRVEAAGTVVVDARAPIVLYETALEPRLYIERSAVVGADVVAGAKETYCPYKGVATYWSLRIGGTIVPDAAWSYDDPLPESLPIRGLLSFDTAVVTVRHDLPSD